MLKGLLQGTPPPRPLFLPIVFSLGAKVENLPLRAFLGNATKISNSLRQIRAHLRSDGVSCYFDPFLEAEALGAEVRWTADDQPPALHWSHPSEMGELPENLRSPEDAAKSGRVNVAVEVIRRLKSLLRDEPLLSAGVAGPFTLAARLTGLQQADAPQREHFSDAALELATATITQVASKLVEAGAGVIFIQEDILPPLSASSCEAWASSLAPAFNIIRFYEALPVLQISDGDAFAQNKPVIFRQQWNCILCPPLASSAPTAAALAPPPDCANIGIAVPPAVFQPGAASSPENFQQLLHTIVVELRPALVTTAGDVPATTDIKLLAKTWEAIHR